MTNDEAKFLLHAYHPDGRNAADPAMQEARDHARRDPALEAWFVRDQQHTAAMTAALRRIAPPPGLRDALIAGQRAGGGVRKSRPTWRALRPLAFAAAFVLLFAAAWWRYAPIPGDTLDEFALNVVQRRFLLAERSRDLDELKTWLAAKHAPLPSRLPDAFEQLHTLGCRTVEFNGRDVSLVCFERNGREFHVFVARRDDIAPASSDLPAQIYERNKHVVASWSDHRNDYVLVSDADRREVEQLL